MAREPETRAFDYDVALSFSGRDRRQAANLAKALQRRGVTVFYDRWIDELWGRDLNLELPQIYSRRSLYVIILYSANYETTPWGQHEFRTALDRYVRSFGREYILPVLLDDSALPPPISSISYLHWSRHRAGGIAEIFARTKLKLRSAASLRDFRDVIVVNWSIVAALGQNTDDIVDTAIARGKSIQLPAMDIGGEFVELIIDPGLVLATCNTNYDLREMLYVFFVELYWDCSMPVKIKHTTPDRVVRTRDGEREIEWSGAVHRLIATVSGDTIRSLYVENTVGA